MSHTVDDTSSIRLMRLEDGLEQILSRLFCSNLVSVFWAWPPPSSIPCSPRPAWFCLRFGVAFGCRVPLRPLVSLDGTRGSRSGHVLRVACYVLAVERAMPTRSIVGAEKCRCVKRARAWYVCKPLHSCAKVATDWLCDLRPRHVTAICPARASGHE